MSVAVTAFVGLSVRKVAHHRSAKQKNKTKTNESRHRCVLCLIAPPEP
ncbi:Uncharacterized protein APZ42_017117 [Daphnia magna]|uniref:Uncharacterized protein n=1 Tax=Daphnia magna TaxID=35525 RepID=A0A165A0R3_9CRUS|nr:Uncharacterized protein APZ42_017117 [Daphnia magna]